MRESPGDSTGVRVGGHGSGDAAAEAAAEAARERQSHVRHELRSPLAVICPLVGLLLEGSAGELTPEQREHLRVLERNVVRLEALIASAAEGGWPDLSPALALPREVALGDLAEDVVALRPPVDREGPPVEVRAGPLPSPRAWADRDDLRRIVANLVHNAVKYTPADGRVVVRAGADGSSGQVWLSVEDTGPGMPPEELARAAEFGFRGELATRLRTPGLGIGLWVCRELAARNGGDISLSSEPGAGLRAVLTLPASRSPAAGLPLGGNTT